MFFAIDDTYQRESRDPLICEFLLLGMQRQGAWACEAYTASSSSQLIETLSVFELKDGVGEVDSSSNTGNH